MNKRSSGNLAGQALLTWCGKMVDKLVAQVTVPQAGDSAEKFTEFVNAITKIINANGHELAEMVQELKKKEISNA